MALETVLSLSLAIGYSILDLWLATSLRDILDNGNEFFTAVLLGVWLSTLFAAPLNCMLAYRSYLPLRRRRVRASRPAVEGVVVHVSDQAFRMNLAHRSTD